MCVVGAGQVCVCVVLPSQRTTKECVNGGVCGVVVKKKVNGRR